jgi:hypothetical protein
LAEFGRLVDFQIHLKRAVVWKSSTPESYNDPILILVTLETFNEVKVDFTVTSACAHHQQQWACLFWLFEVFLDLLLESITLKCGT